MTLACENCEKFQHKILLISLEMVLNEVGKRKFGYFQQSRTSIDDADEAKAMLWCIMFHHKTIL